LRLRKHTIPNVGPTKAFELAILMTNLCCLRSRKQIKRDDAGQGLANARQSLHGTMPAAGFGAAGSIAMYSRLWPSGSVGDASPVDFRATRSELEDVST
jgi:hypothetical protein